MQKSHIFTPWVALCPLFSMVNGDDFKLIILSHESETRLRGEYKTFVHLPDHVKE